MTTEEIQLNEKLETAGIEVRESDLGELIVQLAGEKPYHIVTQIRDAKNMDVLKLVGEKDHVRAVQTGDLIARVVAQTSRQSGLSVVYTELLNFGGEI